MKMRAKFVSAAGVLLLASCGPDAPSAGAADGVARVFSEAGVSLPETMTGGAQLVFPSDLAVDEDGVWIADTGNDRIVHLSHDLELIKEVGGSGAGPGELRAPLFVSTASDQVLVGDLINARISRFRKDGEFVEAIRYPDQVTSFAAAPENAIHLGPSGNRRHGLLWSAGAWTVQRPLAAPVPPERTRGSSLQITLTADGALWTFDPNSGRIWRSEGRGARLISGSLPVELLERLQNERTEKLAGLSRAGHVVIDAPLTKGLSSAGLDQVLIHLPLTDPLALIAEVADGAFRFHPITIAEGVLDMDIVRASAAMRLWENKLYVLGVDGVFILEHS